MKLSIYYILISLFYLISCGDEEFSIGSVCPEDYHISDGGFCVADPIDCSDNPGTFDNGNRKCINPCIDKNCGTGNCIGESAYIYYCECYENSELNEDGICYPNKTFSDIDCYDEIKSEISPIDMISNGDIVKDCIDDICELTIDATAGGRNNAIYRPYIYLSLELGEKVLITDNEAFNSIDWDIAFKRSIIRINSGTSGIGNVEAAYSFNMIFDNIYSYPSRLTRDFEKDNFIDINCDTIYNQYGAILTSIGEWFNYNPSTNSVTPKNYIYFIQKDNSIYKIQFLNWDNGFIKLKYGKL